QQDSAGVERVNGSKGRVHASYLTTVVVKTPMDRQIRNAQSRRMDKFLTTKDCLHVHRRRSGAVLRDSKQRELNRDFWTLGPATGCAYPPNILIILRLTSA
ncbi:MAG: hypothetical protein ACSLE2_06455, partial [Lysobacterales bacterium]